MKEVFLEWQSPEHRFDRKSIDWYWILGIITLGVAILSFYFDNMLFGIFVVIAGISIGFLSFKETKEVLISVTKSGVVFGNKLYPWRSYKFFWIEDEHKHGARILLNPINTFLPLVVVPIHDEIELEDLRQILMKFLEERFVEESMIHKLFDKII